MPTLVLAFLHPSVQPRFSFARKGTATIEGRTFVELGLRELSAPTVVRGPDSRSGSVEYVEGLAAYSGFRQAGVSTQEQFRLPETHPR